MREHSDWLRVILGYKLVQIINSAMILTLNVHRHVQLYRQMYLKDVEIAKKVQIVVLNDENIKQLIYFVVTNKGTNRPINTSTF